MHDVLASIMMIMEDAKIYNEGISVMYADFKGVFNAADHRIMFNICASSACPPLLSTIANNLWYLHH
jgi:hypothetical protein